MDPIEKYPDGTYSSPLGTVMFRRKGVWVQAIETTQNITSVSRRPFSKTEFDGFAAVPIEESDYEEALGHAMCTIENL